ncbi:hypothetical protein GEZ67_04110 [Pseudomonas aeruginosa]|nr:flavin reductase [Pseudomonas aeruginosa]MQG97461.1 hypothetical protein [Pseudomonas aeruginosa]
MQLDFTTIAPAEAYRWLASTVTPRPIAWVSTLSAEGASNLAPFSFFQVISDEPPTLMVNVSLRDDGSLKDTLRNVQATGQLVIHLVGAAQAETWPMSTMPCWPTSAMWIAPGSTWSVAWAAATTAIPATRSA